MVVRDKSYRVDDASLQGGITNITGITGKKMKVSEGVWRRWAYCTYVRQCCTNMSKGRSRIHAHLQKFSQSDPIVLWVGYAHTWSYFRSPSLGVGRICNWYAYYSRKHYQGLRGTNQFSANNRSSEGARKKKGRWSLLKVLCLWDVVSYVPLH